MALAARSSVSVRAVRSAPRPVFSAPRPVRRAMVCRAGAVDEVLEKLKGMTLLEAAELVSQIEKTFGVEATVAAPAMMMAAPGAAPAAGGAAPAAAPEAKTTFDVVLEDIPADKKVAIYKVVRSIANIAVNQVKDFTATLPKVLKEGASKEDAAKDLAELQAAGAKASIK